MSGIHGQNGAVGSWKKNWRLSDQHLSRILNPVCSSIKTPITLTLRTQGLQFGSRRFRMNQNILSSCSSRKSRVTLPPGRLASLSYAQSATSSSGPERASGEEVWLIHKPMYQQTNGPSVIILGATIHPLWRHISVVMMVVLLHFDTLLICRGMPVYTRGRLSTSSFVTNQAVLASSPAKTI